MAVLSDYTSGTITLANGSTAVTGTGTLFDVAKFREGDTLQIQNLTAVIASVNSNTSLTLTAPWSGTSLTDAPYRARYLPDGARVTAQATTLIELLGNGVLSNLAELGVEDGKVPVGNAAGEYELKAATSLGMRDPNNSLAKLADLMLAARQILQTDESGALKAISLAANKFLRTDANGDLALSDLGAAAIALLNLSGTAEADRLPYLTGANGAGLTPITAFARSLLDDPNPASMAVTLGNVWSFLGNGYCKLSFGLYLMWGNTSSTNPDYRVNFPTAFPGFVMYVNMINVYDYGGANNTFMAASTSNLNNSGFDARCRVIQNGGLVGPQSNLPLRWFAIGW